MVRVECGEVTDVVTGSLPSPAKYSGDHRMEQWNMKILDPTGRSSSMQCQTATTVGGTSSFHCRPRLSVVDVGGTCLMLPKAYLLHPMLWTCSRESRETAEVRRIMPGQQLPTGRAEPRLSRARVCHQESRYMYRTSYHSCTYIPYLPTYLPYVYF